MTEVKTICMNCKYHRGGTADEPWYSHICSHPSVQIPVVINPVTGRPIEEVRHCRDVNRGNCEHYEEYTQSKIWRYLTRDLQ